MKKNILSYLLLITFVFANVNILSAGNGKEEIKDGTSRIVIKGTDKVTNVKIYNPVRNETKTYNVGTFYGKLTDNSTTSFYCIDLGHNLATGSSNPYVDAGETPDQITYILNHYYPFTNSQTGSGLNVRQEAAAVQCAIWHYSDGLSLNDVKNNNTIKDRMEEIINDTEANYGSMVRIKTLIISPENESLVEGEDVELTAEVYDLNNDPVANLELTVLVNGEELNGSFITDNQGIITFTIPYEDGVDQAQIAVRARVTIPHGTRYVCEGKADQKQKIVLASPIEDLFEVYSNVTWSNAVDIAVLKSASSQNVDFGENIEFTITVKNNDEDDATNIVVKDLLPADFTLNGFSSSDANIAFDEDEFTATIPTLAGNSSTSFTVDVKAVENNNQNPVDLGIAKDFNLFVFENARFPSSDTEGRMAVGGTVRLENYSVGNRLSSDFNGDVLVAGDKVVFKSGRVYFGNVLYGNTEIIKNTTTVDGEVIQASADHPLPDFDAAESHLNTLSSSISEFTSNGTVTHEYGTLLLKGNDPYLNIFDIEKNQMDYKNTNTMKIDVPNGSSVLVNVDDNRINWTGGLFVEGTGIANVLFNFYNAKVIEIKGIDVRGTILAPKAKIKLFGGVVNGQVICKNIVGKNGGQINNVKFIGTLPQDVVLTNGVELVSVAEVDNNSANDYSNAIVKIQDTSVPDDNDGDNGDGSDSETNWQEQDLQGFNEMIWTIEVKGKNVQYLGTWGGKIYKKNKNEISDVLNPDMGVGFIWDILLDKANSKIYAATEQGIFVSADDGSTWTEFAFDGKDVRTMLMDKNGNILAGIWGEGVFRFDGTNWNELNDGLTDKAVHALTRKGDHIIAGTFGGGGIYKLNGDDAWEKQEIDFPYIWNLAVAKNGNIYAGTFGGGVYVSTDKGVTWNAMNGNIPSMHVYSITTYKNRVFVSTWAGGIYEYTSTSSSLAKTSSFASTARWNEVGLKGYDVNLLYNDEETGTLYAGTKDGKFFAIGDDVTDVDQNSGLPTKFELNQNYPNPFNPTTIIKFAVPENGFYSVKVYNSLGQEVATLLNRELNTGNHKVNFNAANLSSGIYFYQLSGNNVNITKKMILMK